ncbi:MAG TPA: glycosyl hydrolase family 18 protein, partial [Bacteroidota bacterium]|nr:glycosyl hydrolase family 18 protein [Bacteroidota bacterium]
MSDNILMSGKVFRAAILFLCLTITIVANGQDRTKYQSIHQIERARHLGESPGSHTMLSASIPLQPRVSSTGALTKKVLGWHPVWAPDDAYLSYDYTALTHIAYFSYETDTATGSYTSLDGWNTTPLIDTAHRHGVKVLLTVTNFGYGENDKILKDTVKQSRMIDTLIKVLLRRNGDGLNFDFEQVNATQRLHLVSFMRQVSARVKAQIPAAEISMATPAVDFDNAYDFLNLSRACDYLILMGYDYYWSGSVTAGPVAPLQGELYDDVNSVNAYLGTGMDTSKLLLGVPWYGYDWPVV